MAKTRVATREELKQTPRARPDAGAPDRPANPRIFYDLTAVGLCATGLLLGLGLLRPGATGSVGQFLEMGIRLFVGQVVFAAPVLLVVAGVALAADYRRITRPATVFGAGGLLVVLLGWLHLAAWPRGSAYDSTTARFWSLLGRDLPEKSAALVRQPDGGLFGALTTTMLSPLDVLGSYVMLVALGLSAMLVLTDTTLAAIGEAMRERSRNAAARAAAALDGSRAALRERRGARARAPFVDVEAAAAAGTAARRRVNPLPPALTDREEAATLDGGAGRTPAHGGAEIDSEPAAPQATGEALAWDPDRLFDLEPRGDAPPAPRAPIIVTQPRRAKPRPVPAGTGEFVFPPLDLLDPPKPRAKKIAADTEANIEILEGTLAQFKIKAQVVEIADGPTVTRYEIRLGEGIHVKKILDLADNIAMSLAAMSVRVEAPIPGKSAIGIEVPKKSPALVTLRECIETEEFVNHPSPLCFALGKDVAGSAQYADLLRMPHLLIAGATNSGKSACLNVLIASLLYRARPEELKLIMIDPKRVELTLFEGIPHLIHPVVKDVKQAAGLLRWVLKEMERRYDLFAKAMTRNIEGYNGKACDHPDARQPFIVVIIDELADLMMLQGPEVEQSICRLAQLARATGIHLVVATQRPSVDVITGLIKANVPSRIAFTVTSQIDSRTILDGKGAESLIGRGDMLFKPVYANKSLRVQGAFLREEEVCRVVEHLKRQGPPAFIAEALTVDSAALGGSGRESEEDAEDDLFEPAARFIVTTGHASTSMIQRKFKIGYTRAARLVDMMEQRGIVGALDGARPREIMMSPIRLDEMFRNTREALFNTPGDLYEAEPAEEFEAYPEGVEGDEDPFGRG